MIIIIRNKLKQNYWEHLFSDIFGIYNLWNMVSTTEKNDIMKETVMKHLNYKLWYKK